MAVFRVEKTKDFTIMCNHHLRNKKLSLKAKGLLSLMLSLPEDWDYTTKGLAHICKDGIDAISTALKELEQQGYLTRERIRLPNGRLGDIEYTIHEQPATPDIPPNLPKRENPRQVNPVQAFPEQVKPVQDNPAQLNTNRSKTEELKMDLSSTYQSIYPKAGERKYNSETQDWMDEVNAYREFIMTNIEYDILCERYGTERMDEVVELMLEAVISQRPYACGEKTDPFAYPKIYGGGGIFAQPEIKAISCVGFFCVRVYQCRWNERQPQNRDQLYAPLSCPPCVTKNVLPPMDQSDAYCAER